MSPDRQTNICWTNVLFDPIQISLFSFIGILFQAKGIANLSRSFLGLGFISTDIINYRDFLGIISILCPIFVCTMCQGRDIYIKNFTDQFDMPKYCMRIWGTNEATKFTF
jgi:hypothetical protein